MWRWSEFCDTNGELLTFTGNASSTRGDVMLLHGFPEWSDMYMPIMQQLKDIGYRSVACNQRGYSPLASPDGQSITHDSIARFRGFRMAPTSVI